MDIDRFYTAELDDHQQALTATRDALREPFRQLAEACLKAINGGGRIFLFGNGGSASDAQHLATELIVRYKRDRASIPAIALNTDTSALTAIANDYRFEDLFARQIEGLCRKGDFALAISTSGNSENVIRGLQMAKKMGAVAAGLSGRDGGRMKGLADPLLIVPSNDTARIQEMHITIGHLLCGVLEEEFALS
jgi:D-sedoheptulose 7-phosphate isomerase